jgi:hypothetical protein
MLRQGAARMQLMARHEGFSVDFPDGFPEPEKSIEVVPGIEGDISLIQYLSATDTVVSGVFITDYSNQVNLLHPQSVLDTGQEGLLEDLVYVMEKQVDYQHQGYPARRLQYRETDGGIVYYTQVCFIYVKPRMYQLHLASINPARLDKPEIQAFFDSFRIL